MPVVPRAGLLWLGFMVALWSVFAVGLLTHPQDWIHVRMVEADVGWNVFWYILRNNLMLALLIIGGNLFVRFGRITPGVVILVIQAIIIGWTAGTNSFAEPFATVHAANIAFLRIGLWETTAYVLMCGATLNKSLFMAETFPAKTWAKITKWNEVAFTRTEIVISILALLSLLGAAYTEAFFPLPVR
ncbi:MAG TPA: hypothetical protein VK897_18015 [Anaerolineales bacterium]|nr:hypothetical protein [Anaerolineales bacterium]